MAPAVLPQYMHVSSEQWAPGEAEEVLVSKHEAAQSRRFTFLGVAVVGLLVTALALRSGSKHLRVIVAPAFLEQKAEAARLPKVCYTDGPDGDLVKYSMSDVPDGVCCSYRFDGKAVHVPVAESTCETMMNRPTVYEDVTCCTEDLCNADVERQPAHSRPSVCYVGFPGEPGPEAGELDEYLMPTAGPVTYCARYDYDGETAYTIADKDLCDTLKSAPELYVNAMCCDTDYCNALEYHKQHAHSIPTECYETAGDPDGVGGAMPVQTAGVPTARCATYVVSGQTWQIIASVSTCNDMKAHPQIYKDLMCCDTNLCNTIAAKSR